MSIFSNIKDGWLNYMKDMEPEGTISADIKKLVEIRSEICKSCPELVESGFYKVINRIFKLGGGETTSKKNIISAPNVSPSESEKWDGKSYKCRKCGCAFPQNVYAPEKKCPLEKW